jgi:cell division septum initiation protein DivIVA
VTGESELRRSVSEVSARIEEIIDAAERAAESIRGEAEAEAKRYLAEREREADRMAEERARELGELAEVLAERARYVSEQVEGLSQALERTVARMRAGGMPSESSETGLELGGDEPEARSASSPRVGGGAEEPLLRATQMAVAGSERTEIERMLRREFGVEDPNVIVDQILGRPGS